MRLSCFLFAALAITAIAAGNPVGTRSPTFASNAALLDHHSRRGLQSDGGLCSLCQDGSTPSLSDKNMTPQSGQESATCASLHFDALLTPADSLSCNAYHYYGNYCGCATQNVPPEICSLCQDGSSVPDPDFRFSEFEPWLCGWQQEAARFGNIDGVDGCDLFHYIGSQCGCANVVPPNDGCPLCSDGSAPPFATNESVVTFRDSERDYTCANTAAFAVHTIQASDTKACRAQQVVYGSVCGCQSSPAPTCEICPSSNQGLLLATSAPVFSYFQATAPYSQVESHPTLTSCGEAAILLETQVNASECSRVTEILQGACCGVTSSSGLGQGGSIANAMLCTIALLFMAMVKL